MSRYSHLDTDEERLPDGMTRVGYDADTQVYTFQDSDGSYWESAPGCEYGHLTRVGDAPTVGDIDSSQPFLGSDGTYPKTSWRHDLMPLLNFGVIIGVSLLLFLWYLHWSATQRGEYSAVCPKHTESYVIRGGDTCWALGEERGITVDEILASNPKLNCDKLNVGSSICLPS